MFSHIRKRVLTLIARQLRRGSDLVEALLQQETRQEHATSPESKSSAFGAGAGGLPDHWVKLVKAHAPDLLRPVEYSHEMPDADQSGMTVAQNSSPKEPREVNPPQGEDGVQESRSENQTVTKKQHEALHAPGRNIEQDIFTQTRPVVTEEPVEGYIEPVVSAFDQKGSHFDRQEDAEPQEMKRENRSRKQEQGAVLPSPIQNESSFAAAEPNGDLQARKDQEPAPLATDEVDDIVTIQRPLGQREKGMLFRIDHRERPEKEKIDTEHHRGFHPEEPAHLQPSPGGKPAMKKDAAEPTLSRKLSAQEPRVTKNRSKPDKPMQQKAAEKEGHTSNSIDRWPHLLGEKADAYPGHGRSDRWPDLPAEDVFKVDTASSVARAVHRRQKLDREQMGAVWNASPF